MAGSLKDFFSPDLVRRLGASIAAVHPSFDLVRWEKEALEGLGDLSLTDRGRHLMNAMRRQLPEDYEAALEILLASLEHSGTAGDTSSMASFFYLPHLNFVSEHGLDFFEASMRAQYLLTQRFTAEFSIRPFLERHPEATLAKLREWASDPSHHVRRLVSEGTRPRLPWARHLRAFQLDPQPVLELLEMLKDDESLYVRRSVANNLNDIGKDHPQILAATCRRWLEAATPQREWLVRHALRAAVKRGEKEALETLGAGAEAQVEILEAAFTPSRPWRGGKARFEATLVSKADATQKLVVDLAIFFVKANGKGSPKVFKVKNLELEAGDRARVGKTIDLSDLSTRQHYPGWHQAELRINGAPFPAGGFELLP